MRLVFDGSFLLYRSLYIAAKQDKLSRDAAVCAFLRSLVKIAERFPSKEVWIAWDEGIPLHRKEIFSGYKENREKDPNDPIIITFKESRPFLEEWLPKFGVLSLAVKDCEADDIGYYLSHTCDKGVLVSDDKDWLLSLREGWSLFRPRVDEVISYEDVIDEYNSLEELLIFKSLLGDSSDGIPGVPGIGQVNAKKFSNLLCSGKGLGVGVKADIIRENVDIVSRNRRIMSMNWIMSHPNIETLIYSSYDTLSDRFPSQFDWLRFCQNLKNDKDGSSSVSYMYGRFRELYKEFNR